MTRAQLQGMWSVVVFGVLGVGLVACWRLEIGNWGLVGGTAVLCWLVVILPMRQLAVADWRNRPASRLVWQRGWADLILLILAGGAYFQLVAGGSGLARSSMIFLLAPIVLLVTAVLLTLRLVPWLMRLVKWLGQHRLRFGSWLSMARLSWDGGRSVRVMGVVGVMAVIILINSTFANSLEARHWELARYAAGGGFAGGRY